MFVGLQIITIDTETLHRPEGVQTIFAGEVITDVASAIGEACDNGGAMRNALVAGHGEFGRKISYRAYPQ
jgi:hypothetical protein